MQTLCVPGLTEACDMNRYALLYVLHRYHGTYILYVVQSYTSIYTHIYSQNVLYYIEFCHETNINRMAKLQTECIHSCYTQIVYCKL